MQRTSEKLAWLLRPPDSFVAVKLYTTSSQPQIDSKFFGERRHGRQPLVDLEEVCPSAEHLHIAISNCCETNGWTS